MTTPTKTPIEPGLIARAVAGVRYALTGKQPDWFGPGEPLPPVAQEQAIGRQWDFPVRQNIVVTPRAGENITFAQLRSLADNCDILRLAIETRKDQVARLRWNISPVDPKKASDLRCDQLRVFFRRPDKIHLWETWVRMLLEDMFVIDAPAVYLRPTVGGKPYSLDLIDGATIKPLIDETGRQPVEMEAAAFQQVLKGLPAVDYTNAEMLYMPRNPRTNRMYGFSPVEQIVLTVNIAMRRALHQLQFYTEGNIPEALIGVPETWNPDQIKQFQAYWDSILEGQTDARRHAKFVPGAFKMQETKSQALTDKFDEWLARVVCFAFSLSPQPFIQMMNRATSETAQDQSAQEGLQPILQWIKSLHDVVIQERFGYADLHFEWEVADETKPLERAQIHEKYIAAKVLHPDEVRAELGLDPLTPEQKEDLNPEPPPMQPGGEGKDEPPDKQPPEKEALGKAKKALPLIDRERPEIERLYTDLNAVVVAFLAKQGPAIASQVINLLAASTEKMSADDASKLARILEQLSFVGWVALADDTLPIIEAIMANGMWEGLKQVGIEDATEDMLAVVNESAVAYAKDRSAELVGMKWVDGELVPNPSADWAITESTREVIRANIAEAMEQGLSNDALATKIADGYAFSAERSEIIARTETAFADVAGNLAGYKQSGVVEAKEWLTAADCCPKCHELNGKIVPLDGVFPGGKQGPPLHPRCRCDVLPVLENK